MGSPLQVDPAQMAKGQVLVQDASTEIKGILAGLQGDVDELLVNWQSGGATGFNQAHAAWSAKAKVIANALDDLGVKLGVVGKTAGAGDASVADSFRGFAS